ncbi:MULTISPECIES: hypothetical protein [Acetobacteraceae]|uniref:Uncharacterized protein n=1 Tax=Gluconobacter albidus TaxID=318683 RepID=A0A149TLV2_9PROT|nr:MULTISPECIES: hypothetical protein [Acetobacteraceae]KXV49876.1 hypothetical protein AD945_03275 [Gluconobacter albidus]MCP1271423.1 hypothetical protein [Acetobacter cerevisiae]MCP1279377.1 hypothetical protein [Acetobacter cerevisiae]
MSTNWLQQELAQKSNARTDSGDPILTVFLPTGREERIYSPDSDEYRVSADVVEKAARLGATIVAYSSMWCGVTIEGKEHAKTQGISIIPFAGLFGYMKRKGVIFTR